MRIIDMGICKKVMSKGIPAGVVFIYLGHLKPIVSIILCDGVS